MKSETADYLPIGPHPTSHFHRFKVSPPTPTPSHPNPQPPTRLPRPTRSSGRCFFPGRFMNSPSPRAPRKRVITAFAYIAFAIVRSRELLVENDPVYFHPLLYALEILFPRTFRSTHTYIYVCVCVYRCLPISKTMIISSIIDSFDIYIYSRIRMHTHTYIYIHFNYHIVLYWNEISLYSSPSPTQPLPAAPVSERIFHFM